MTSSQREVVICIDMGMTGTDGETANWTYRGLAQENTKSRPKWHMAPKTMMGLLSRGAANATGTLSPSTVPGGPGSQLELHRWVRHYLGAFCAEVVAVIDRDAAPKWRDADVIWNFTVPGSWSALPVVADFKRLAGEAVSPCFPNGKGFRICCDVKEATASAQSLLVEGSVSKKKEYEVGNVVISCDIGGATTDIAISTVSSAGTLTTWPQLETESAGMVSIEKEFWLHASHFFRSVGASNPDQLALEIARGKNFQRARAEFMKGRAEERVSITLPDSCNVEKWSPLEATSPRMSTINGGKLSIHRDVFESFFRQFAEHIEAALDEAVTTARTAKKEPAVIGFCGGGCRTEYAIKRFQSRYDPIPIADHTHLTIQPEMATVVGSTLIWDQNKLSEFTRETSFGIETSDSIKWRRAELNLAASNFSRAYPWVVNFPCNKHGSHNTHRMVMTSTPPPDNSSDALRLLNSKSWVIEVDLRKEKGSTLSWNRKYQLVCNIAGPRDIDFSAQSLVTEEDIPCRVTREGSYE
ncbi:uncharacterized protein BP5553_09370 [Venustampulla echinocandica]|uniref:Actin-like ATPase domain-containing protein n=1 Tax=Venustampulla echinocandica TaxID=2656787 RepID=A0A370TCJ1_9HELO|nr:uncharacterized protein BP5553_09370 [Venustampulla echinocandica]RDL31968.1 hypothetical protein BP5553_09370 [Venustampulla echinocandica]